MRITAGPVRRPRGRSIVEPSAYFLIHDETQSRGALRQVRARRSRARSIVEPSASLLIHDEMHRHAHHGRSAQTPTWARPAWIRDSDALAAEIAPGLFAPKNSKKIPEGGVRDGVALVELVDCARCSRFVNL